MSNSIPNTVEIFTDGSCIGNPGKGGWSCILKDSVHTKELYGCSTNTTNNRMELAAVVAALTALKRRCNVTVYSDSKYVVDTMNCGWSRNANVDLWERIDTLVRSHNVQFVWVKGHHNCQENIRCDELARSAALHQRSNTFIDIQ